MWKVVWLDLLKLQIDLHRACRVVLVGIIQHKHMPVSASVPQNPPTAGHEKVGHRRPAWAIDMVDDAQSECFNHPNNKVT